jgi:hypothetical protein
MLDGPVGAYDYRTTFNLAGFNPSTASITGQWSTDNEGVEILINGVATGKTIPNPWSFESFTSSAMVLGSSLARIRWTSSSIMMAARPLCG